ncbi:MAG TPA: asparagine synthase C-terminal domain-containing protein [Ilumatobacteraceae bacterium]|nr:asparagine synthase C-terminal domain-containing protein [Ilumatobacteraceae bacterium]
MDELYLMTPMEIAWGYLFGHIGSLPTPTNPKAGPREVLEQVVRQALLRPPCGVAFSGGRDSSLVLAVATHVARRDGLPEPVPITRVFPNVPESQEHEWQEAVVRHLGLRDWQRLIIEDDFDVVGPHAVPHLLAHGVVWPPSIAVELPLLDTVQGGSLLDGEGGDEVLGVSAHRVESLTDVIRRPRPLRWGRVRSALGALAPAGLRGRHARQQWEAQRLPWLRPNAWEPLIAALEESERERPLSFAASVRMVPTRRSQVLGGHNVRIFARQRNVEASSPLLNPDFVHALAGDGGVLGRLDRTTALRVIASDLLPDEVLSRTSKATFTMCYMAEHTRQFAAQWSGHGLDPDLVDPEALRRNWLGERPAAPTAALLQAAWLASADRNRSFDPFQQPPVADAHDA